MSEVKSLGEFGRSRRNFAKTLAISTAGLGLRFDMSNVHKERKSGSSLVIKLGNRVGSLTTEGKLGDLLNPRVNKSKEISDSLTVNNWVDPMENLDILVARVAQDLGISESSNVKLEINYSRLSGGKLCVLINNGIEDRIGSINSLNQEGADITWIEQDKLPPELIITTNGVYSVRRSLDRFIFPKVSIASFSKAGEEKEIGSFSRETEVDSTTFDAWTVFSRKKYSLWQNVFTNPTEQLSSVIVHGSKENISQAIDIGPGEIIVWTGENEFIKINNSSRKRNEIIRIDDSGRLELGEVKDFQHVFWGTDSFTDDPHRTWILIPEEQRKDNSGYKYRVGLLVNDSGKLSYSPGSMYMPYSQDEINPGIRVVEVNNVTKVFLTLKSGEEFSFCTFFPGRGLVPSVEHITAQEFLDRDRQENRLPYLEF